jgi:hypothetical protein
MAVSFASWEDQWLQPPSITWAVPAVKADASDAS